MQSDIIWWSILLEADSTADLDLLGCELIDLGASGTELLENHQIQCFLQATKDGLASFSKNVTLLPLKIISAEPVPATNWVQKCEEVWQKLEINNLTIIPVLSLEQGQALPQATAQEIYIIPGCGFGTGHHATTNQATAILQNEDLKKCCPKRVLDVGTGSGLLAIAASKLFNASVDAFDNDPDAVANAIENVTLNNVTSSVSVCQADAASWFNGEYDLVIANLYAELLEKLHDVLYKATKHGAWLLISGFHSADLPELSRYTDPLWERKEIRKAEGWSAMLLKKY